MTGSSTSPEADRIEVRLDAGDFPRDALYAAAFAFTDRCYVRLVTMGDPERGPQTPPGTTGGVSVVLRAKVPGSIDAGALTAEVREELARQAFRQRLEEEGGEMIRAIAVGAPGEPLADPGLDDLLAAPEAFDDPLGIATSWEEKHGKKEAGA